AAAVADVEKLLNEYFAKQAKIIRANVMGELPGKRYIYEDLARSLADGNYLVAKSCLDTIREMGRPEDLPAPAQPEGSKEKEEEKSAGTGSASNVSGTMGYPLIEAL